MSHMGCSEDKTGSCVKSPAWCLAAAVPMPCPSGMDHLFYTPLSSSVIGEALKLNGGNFQLLFFEVLVQGVLGAIPLTIQ